MYTMKNRMCARPASRGGHYSEGRFPSMWLGTTADRSSSTVPPVNILKSSQGYHLEFAVPGLQRESFRIQAEGNELVVSAGREEASSKEAGTYTRREFHYNTFRRAFTLPENVDTEKITARYVQGILRVELPLREGSPAALRSIEVN